MATYLMDAAVAKVPAKTGLETVTAIANITVAVGLAAGDIIQGVKIPKNAVLTELIISCSASLGATLTAEVGDGNVTNRHIVSGTFGQGAADFKRLGQHTGHGFQYTVEDTLDIKINTAATPTTGAVITMSAQYYVP
jgi:hypothetical protein